MKSKCKNIQASSPTHISGKSRGIQDTTQSNWGHSLKRWFEISFLPLYGHRAILSHVANTMLPNETYNLSANIHKHVAKHNFRAKKQRTWHHSIKVRCHTQEMICDLTAHDYTYTMLFWWVEDWRPTSELSVVAFLSKDRNLSIAELAELHTHKYHIGRSWLVILNRKLHINMGLNCMAILVLRLPYSLACVVWYSNGQSQLQIYGPFFSRSAIVTFPSVHVVSLLAQQSS